MSDKSICCGRRPDAFKVWLMMKRYGIDGFREIARYAYDKSRFYR